MPVFPHCRRKSPLQPPDRDPGAGTTPPPTILLRAGEQVLPDSHRAETRASQANGKRGALCTGGGPLFALHTYSHFKARRCARSSPNHGPGVLCSKSRTSEIPAKVRPRSGRAEPRQSPPPEACSRGFRRTAKYPLVLARVDHPRSQYGFRFFFFSFLFFIFSFNWWLWLEGGASLGQENQTEAEVSKV